MRLRRGAAAFNDAQQQQQQQGQEQRDGLGGAAASGSGRCGGIVAAAGAVRAADKNVLDGRRHPGGGGMLGAFSAGQGYAASVLHYCPPPSPSTCKLEWTEPH